MIRIHVVAGRELKKADVNLFGKGKSDPYIKMYSKLNAYLLSPLTGLSLGAY